MFSCRKSVLLFLMIAYSGGVGALTHEALHQHTAPEVQPQTTKDTAAPAAPKALQLLATLGQTALLPCDLPDPPPSLRDLRLFWQTAKRHEVVHVFIKGREEFEHQSPAYHNKTRLFTSQLQFGNFSLELRNVSEHDNLTTFQCVVCHGSLDCKTTLIDLWTVERKDDGGKEESVAPPADRRVWHIGIPATACLLGLLILTFIICLCPGTGNKCSSSSPYNSTDPERGKGPQNDHLMAEESTVELEMREEDGGERKREREEDGEERESDREEDGGEKERDREEDGGAREQKQDGGGRGPWQWSTALCPCRTDTVEDNNNNNNNSNRRTISALPV
ncbi:uncharacterized protein LOC121690805 [Alosa sapidissima]|uniref:uncharacterized protein LOC121690805 n=1 Tax=Alosa sapidissima TaxID=34773 RepID=UPI001C0860FB|nr:uncharacterized protein LOC121690805 [Alosa sapidissima]XP_041927061.1 uncharacterized protein LOC121690805 [Alosa sapidissima]XP_041927062.1 uncharacterized protein LOC121690805 [Alosa sapidissima]